MEIQENIINILLTLNKNDFPNIFKINTEDKIKEQIIYLLTIGYNSVWGKEGKINSKDIVNNIDNLCRKFKDDVVNNINDKNYSVITEIDKLKTQINSLNVDKKMDEFNIILNDLFGINNTSCKKGEISEDFIYQIFENKYKNYCYDKKRHIPHNADGELNSPTGLKSLVEIKNYTNSVNNDEIEKFKYDLYHTGINYGLFISIKSGIIGHTNIDYKIIKHNNKDYHIIFISNLLNESSRLEAGILLLEKIFSLNKNVDKQQDINFLYDNITTHLKEIEKLTITTSQLKDKFLIIERNIQDNLNDYYKNFRDYEIDLTNKIKKIWTKLVSEIDNTEYKLSIMNLDESFIILNELKDNKDKCYVMVCKLFDIIKNNNLIIKIEDTSWKIYNIEREEEIGNIKKMKKKIIFLLLEPCISITFDSKNDNEKNYLFINNIL